jgi:curved DNA-binding protein CbpA
MNHKDYYKLLEIHPTATPAEIKKSYRRLALKYHPDKNFGNQLYEAKFKEIQEAYRVLSDTRRRQDYNNRRQSPGNEKRKQQHHAPTTPQTIFSQVLEFRKKISVLDPDRMNKLALFQQIQLILSSFNINLLQEHNDHTINKKIIEEIMYCSRHLPYPHIEKICFQLTALAGGDNALYQRIYQFSKQARITDYWNKYKIIAALIAALVLCFAIYQLSTSI